MRFFSNHNLVLCILISLSFTFQSHQSDAKSLSLHELNEFVIWVQCSETCEEEYPLTTSPSYEEQEDLYECMSKCKAPARIWEKDGTRSVRDHRLSPRMYSIDRHDMELAILEYQANKDDENRDLICYPEDFLEDNRNGEEITSSVVIPGSLCPYEEGAEQSHNGCPHLQFITSEEEAAEEAEAEAEVSQTTCTLEKCRRATFVFDELPPQLDIDNNVAWFTNSRPLNCPQVVCDLFNEGGELHNYTMSEDEDDVEWLTQQCSPSDQLDNQAHNGEAHVPHWLNHTLPVGS